MKERTILVIEDNEMNMKLMRAILELGRYRMLEAMDAETGLNLARKNPPDLILMDIQLPGMDGLSAMRILKADPDLDKIPVLAMSGLAMQSDIDKAMHFGFSDYIVKPSGVQDILQTIAKFLADQQSNE